MTPRTSFSYSQASELLEASKEQQDQLSNLPEKEIQKIKRKAVPFFRIWFGLNKLDLAKTVVGSFAAAVSGISKPLFGFFIMTIGAAYYKQDAMRKVGWYSAIFCLVGLLTLITHTLQHFFYGVVGETAMRNLRGTLFSGTLSHLYHAAYVTVTVHPHHKTIFQLNCYFMSESYINLLFDYQSLTSKVSTSTSKCIFWQVTD